VLRSCDPKRRPSIHRSASRADHGAFNFFFRRKEARAACPARPRV
jgi:hypothetical protein